ncbi:MAG: hypothetical protein DMF59_20655, partial [Acidobacteria bacterium]
MRGLSVIVALLVTVPAFADRRHTVQPPRNSACPQGVVVQPTELNWLVLSGDTFFLSDRLTGLQKAPKSGGPPVPVQPTIGLEIPQFAVD